MKNILALLIALSLVGCASDQNVTLDKATVTAKPVTGGNYKIKIEGYSRTKMK